MEQPTLSVQYQSNWRPLRYRFGIASAIAFFIRRLHATLNSCWVCPSDAAMQMPSGPFACRGAIRYLATMCTMGPAWARELIYDFFFFFFFLPIYAPFRSTKDEEDQPLGSNILVDALRQGPLNVLKFYCAEIWNSRTLNHARTAEQ